MSSKKIILIVTFLMLGNFLVTHVVINFFHFHDHETAAYHSLDEDFDSLQEYYGSCKVCQLDIFHDLFYFIASTFYFEKILFAFLVVSVVFNNAASLNLPAGRAPPLAGTTYP